MLAQQKSVPVILCHFFAMLTGSIRPVSSRLLIDAGADHGVAAPAYSETRRFSYVSRHGERAERVMSCRHSFASPPS